MRSALLLALFSLLATALHAGCAIGQIESVHNGDSFVFVSGNDRYEVRLVGVACPVALLRGGQPFCDNAKAMTQNFNNFGPLKLEVVGFDMYGRALGWITTVDDRYSLNLSLLAYGLAELDADYFSLLNRATRQDIVYNEQTASGARAGVWSVADHESPEAYRQRLHLRG